MQLDRVVELALREDIPSKGGMAFLEARCAKRYALGKNAETLALHGMAPLDGIIDDYGSAEERWHGIRVLRTAEAERDACVVSCSTSIRPVAALDHVRASGFRHVATFAEVVRAAGGALPWPEFVRSQRAEMARHLAEWQEIHDALADEESKRTLRDVVGFRLSADPEYMRGYAFRVDDQYFEDFMEYSREVFVDAGGYDGDTTEAFAERYPDYRKVLFFEPSSRNMAAARARLAHVRDVHFFPLGLSDSAGILRFDPEGGSASSVSEAGSDEVPCDALDALVREPISFLKMDLEGWEMPALRGAETHIRNCRPKLAIAVYHNSRDLRLIYQYVQALGHDYRVFLRHYTEGWSETVLYFC